MVSLADNSPSPQGFSGDRRLSLDPKNRITIPAKFREGGGRSDRDPEELQVLKSPTDPCLLAYRPADFDRVRQRVEQSPLPEPKKKLFRRMFNSSANTTTVDKQGRMVLQENFRTALGIDTEVVVLGAGDHFEIWNAEQWDERQRADFADYAQIAGEYAGL